MGRMKMRFEARCPRCSVVLRRGTRALRVYGGYWHLDCHVEYQRYRRSLHKRESK